MIEPNPHAREVIATSVAAVRPAPIVVDVALGDAPGSAQLHIWRDAGADRGASLLENVSGEAKMSIDVEVRTLDSVCDDLGLVPDLLKLDLQGGELAALRGATQASSGPS